MPYFAPNKYVIKSDNKGKDYEEYTNLPDLERIIEVTEDQANQVMRKQSQWIEVTNEIKPEIKHEEEIKEAPKEMLSPFKKMGRPKK